MAEYDNYKPTLGKKDYLTRYNEFVDASETVANEIEAARETVTSGATSLLQNLQENYAKYVLEADIDGGAVSGTAHGTSTFSILYDPYADFEAANITSGDIIVDLTSSSDAGMEYSTVISRASAQHLYVEHPIIEDTWADKKYSVGGKACKSMPPALYSNDYATKGYLDSLTGAGITDITDVGTGTLNANDVLVINSIGDAITGRPTQFYTNYYKDDPITTANDSSYVAAFNDNANVDCSGGVVTITLPAGRIGGIISFTDVYGTIDDTHYFRLIAAPGEKIMGTILASSNEHLVADVNAHTGFSLVYVDASFGWAIINLQR